MRRTLTWLLRLLFIAAVIPNLMIWLPWTQSWLKDQLAKQAKLQVASVSGCFPFYLTAKNVEFQHKGQDLTAESATFWLSPGMLLAGWVQVEEFYAEGVELEVEQLKRELPRLHLSGSGGWCWANGQWRGDLTAYHGDSGAWSKLSAKGKPLHPVHLSVLEPARGLLSQIFDFKNPSSSELRVDLRPESDFSRLRAFFRWESEELALQSCGELHWERDGILELRSFHVEGPRFRANGSGSVDNDLYITDSELNIQVDDIAELPGLNCCGGVELTVRASGPLLEPQLSVLLFSDYLDVSRHQLGSLRCEATINKEAADISCSTLLNRHTLISKVSLQRNGDLLELSNANLNYNGQQLELSGGYDLTSQAYWFSGTASGRQGPAWQLRIVGDGNVGEQPSLHIGSLDGHLESLPIELDRPTTITSTEQGIQISPFRVRVGNGALSGELTATEHASDLSIDLAALPADLIAILQPQVKLDGLLTGELALRDRGDGAHGSLNISVSGLRFLESDFEDLDSVAGSMRLSIQPTHWELSGDLTGLDPHPSQVSAELPIRLGLRPLKIEFPAKMPLRGFLEAHGHLAPFLQPLMVDSNRIRGQVSAKLALAGNWGEPELHGELRLLKGTYESLFTGTTFKGVQAKVLADGRSLILEKFTAHSGKHGLVSGNGILSLDPKNDFPFTVDMELRKTDVIQVDNLRAKVAGKLTLEGTLNQATLSGNVKLTEAHIHIPDTLPKELHSLDVIFVNDADGAAAAVAGQLVSRVDPYPLYLNVNIDAPKNLYLNGRGLTTEWGGEVAVKGSTARPMLFGTANLLRGDFLIAGTLSPLTHGVIHMDGLASREVQISLSCDLEVGDVSLPLTLSGPLHGLEIEGLSDLSRVDALLLAQAAMRLTGGQVAPDILENVRRKTGLDLLDFGTVGEDDEREFIVQVGKYFSRGVSVSVARTMAREGARTALDLTLTKNLKLRAEVSEGDEAATDSTDIKLLLKWKYDY